MKLLTLLTVFVLVFMGCTSLLDRELHQEGKSSIENYEDTRMKYEPEKIKSEIKAQLVGKWQFMGIEVEKGTVNAQVANSTSERDQTVSPSDTSTQTPTMLELPQSNRDERMSGSDEVQLPPIIVHETKDNEKVAAAKAALLTANRKNLTLEFFEERTSYYYRGSNRGRNVTGQISVVTSRFGDVPVPFVQFRRRTGPKMLEFLFSSDPARRASARKKQTYVENIQRVEGKNFVNTGGKRDEKASPKSVSYRPISAIGIEVTDDRLCLILHGDMELTPKGWMRTGGLRCTFKRIE